MNTLEFDGLYLEFGMQRVLSSVHMVGRTGRIVGLLGRNGSGKSCLMRIVFGTLSATCKSVRYNHQPLLGTYLKRKIIAYLPQDDLLPAFVTFREAARLYRVDETILESFTPAWNMLRSRTSSEMSGGERRWLEVLLVLFSHHPFCILDEPFSGLSPLQIEKLQSVLQTVKHHKGIFITDHLHRAIRAIADDLYVLDSGATNKILHADQLVELGYLNEL